MISSMYKIILERNKYKIDCDSYKLLHDNSLKEIAQLREENKNLKEFNNFLNMKLESVENKTKSHIDDELEFAYKNWKAALSMGSSIAEEKFKADMENLKLKEEIERLQNKLKE